MNKNSSVVDSSQLIQFVISVRVEQHGGNEFVILGKDCIYLYSDGKVRLPPEEDEADVPCEYEGVSPFWETELEASVFLESWLSSNNL